MDEAVAFKDAYNEVSCMIVSRNIDQIDIFDLAKKFVSNELTERDRWDTLSSGEVSFMFCNWLSMMYNGDYSILDDVSIEIIGIYQTSKGCHVFDIVSGIVERTIIWL